MAKSSLEAIEGRGKWSTVDEDEWDYGAWMAQNGFVGKAPTQAQDTLQFMEPSPDSEEMESESTETAPSSDDKILEEMLMEDILMEDPKEPSPYSASFTLETVEWRQMEFVEGRGTEWRKRNQYYYNWKQCHLRAIKHRPEHQRHAPLQPAKLSTEIILNDEGELVEKVYGGRMDTTTTQDQGKKRTRSMVSSDQTTISDTTAEDSEELDDVGMFDIDMEEATRSNCSDTKRSRVD